jgi:hypothetical protein
VGNLLVARDTVNKSFVQIEIILTDMYQSCCSECWCPTSQPKAKMKMSMFPKKQLGIKQSGIKKMTTKKTVRKNSITKG